MADVKPLTPNNRITPLPTHPTTSLDRLLGAHVKVLYSLC